MPSPPSNYETPSDHTSDSNEASYARGRQLGGNAVNKDGTDWLANFFKTNAAKNGKHVSGWVDLLSDGSV